MVAVQPGGVGPTSGELSGYRASAKPNRFTQDRHVNDELGLLFSLQLLSLLGVISSKPESASFFLVAYVY